MANNVVGVLVLSMLMVLVLSAESQAKHSPAPSTSPPENSTAPAAQPINLPMYGITEGSLHPEECPGRCTARCSATAYKKPCMFFCQKCCAKCLCVPPGTYGNKQFCGCYNSWKTKRGGPKCP